jgi:hypothetical protein
MAPGTPLAYARGSVIAEEAQLPKNGLPMWKMVWWAFYQMGGPILE